MVGDPRRFGIVRANNAHDCWRPTPSLGPRFSSRAPCCAHDCRPCRRIVHQRRARERGAGLSPARSGAHTRVRPGGGLMRETQELSEEGGANSITYPSNTAESLMRITTKGQVTIPLAVRETLGLLPH